MEIPIQVAVRILPTNEGNNSGKFDDSKSEDANGNKMPTVGSCVQAIPIATVATPFNIVKPPTALPGGQLDSIAAGLIQVGPHSFPVTHALANGCTQSQVYYQTVFPLISLFMEGFDASVVTYGQRRTGKSYTLFGPGLDCVYGEEDQGIVQRCAREIFSYIGCHPERTYAVNIGFVEIYGESIRDLLGMGNIHCTSVTEVFHWLQLGLNAKSEDCATHRLFTLTLEQQWITKEGLIQHRLSTASFSDLCATDRHFLVNAQDQPTTVPNDVGLQVLEQVVNTLTDPALMYSVNGNIPYSQTTLTTLLKDSFGGRAQTLVMLCVSPLEKDLNETMCNLQFGFKVQCVRNYVIMNTFSDDNTPISPDHVRNELTTQDGGEHFGLQFAAGQWFKLVSNAEGLFSKLVSSNAITDLEKEQIEEWLFLKQECEECLSSSEVLRTQKQLVPIEEAEEPQETVSEPETFCQLNSDNDTDTESQRPDFTEKLESLIKEFREKTDSLVMEKHEQFLAKQPKAVMESQESFNNKIAKREVTEPETLDHLDERKVSVGGRRRSIQPGASLSSAEIAMLNRVASREQTTTKTQEDYMANNASELQAASAQMRIASNSALENIQTKLRKLDTDIEARQRQIKEVEQTMQLKQNIVTELVKNSETRSNAKQRFHKKKAKLEAEYEKTKKHLAKAILQGKVKTEIERLRALTGHIEQRLEDLASMKHIAGDSGQKVKKLQQSLHESKKIVEELQKKVKKEKKLREQLDAELKLLKEKENSKALVKVETSTFESGEVPGRQLKEVQARISHLDHILREKSENLEQYNEGEGTTEQKEGLRHEIRNLRRTRDHLLEQRCSLDRKLKRDKMLTQREERKLLECDEAIEAIDAAIEFKNELICGHKSIDTSERLQREKGEQMLMARLNNLSPEEMRTLLYKYFTKVIDLRDSSRKLEIQLVQLERERDAWEWKERVLSNAVRQARLEGERNVVLLQRQHEMKLTLMLRHLADETSASSNSYSERERSSLCTTATGNLNLALAPSTTHLQHHTTANSPLTTSTSDFGYELDFYKAHKMVKQPSSMNHKAQQHSELEMCPLPADALTKYKPLEKLKDKERGSTKNNLFAKFQVLTRYAAQSTTTTTGGESSTVATAGGAGGAAVKKKDKEFAAAAAIPQENLKRLMSAPSATKVTRQKNKIIIQDSTRNN